MAGDEFSFMGFKASGRATLFTFFVSGWVLAFSTMAYTAWGPPNKVDERLTRLEEKFDAKKAADSTWQGKLERVLRKLTKGKSDEIFLSEAK